MRQEHGRRRDQTHPSPDAVVAATSSALQSRLLRASVWGAAGFSVVGVVWGLAAGSRMILFDGVYSTISLALSLLSLSAYRAVQRGPDDRYHYGRDALSSLVLVVKGVAIGALCLTALTGAILDLLAGGTEVDVGSAAAYAALATVGCGAMTLRLRRAARAPGADLLRAEAAQWLLDTVLSVAVLLGFLAALLAQARGFDDLAALVDPVLVGTVSLAFLVLPVRLVRDGLRGVLAAAPQPEVQRAIQAAVSKVADVHGFARTSCRVAVFGTRYDLTIGLLADADTDLPDLDTADRIRAELQRNLDALPYDLLVSVSFTGDARWLD